MTTALGSLTIVEAAPRAVTVARKTRETDVTIRLSLDGSGRAAARTGIGFYDHLLMALGHHGLFDLDIAATGDLEVDEHHTVEDVALVLGAAFNEALADRAAINRFGSGRPLTRPQCLRGTRRLPSPPLPWPGHPRGTPPCPRHGPSRAGSSPQRGRRPAPPRRGGR